MVGAPLHPLQQSEHFGGRVHLPAELHRHEDGYNDSQHSLLSVEWLEVVEAQILPGEEDRHHDLQQEDENALTDAEDEGDG